MEYLLLALIWFLNLGISAWNAYAVGKMWIYAKQMGLWARIITWCAYIMSGCGFSWCFLLPLSLLAYVNHWFGYDDKALLVTMNLGYLVIAPAVCFSGLFIWLDSLANAWRQKTISSVAVAGWNTYAQIHNMVEVFTNIGPAFENVSSFFSSFKEDDDSENDKSKALMVLVIALVVVSVVAGFLVATTIVVKVARNESRLFQDELKEKVDWQK